MQKWIPDLDQNGYVDLIKPIIPKQQQDHYSEQCHKTKGPHTYKQ